MERFHIMVKVAEGCQRVEEFLSLFLRERMGSIQIIMQRNGGKKKGEINSNVDEE